MLNPKTIRYSENLTQAYRGLDALHRAANPDDRWGIVVLDMEEAPRAVEFASWEEAQKAFERLATQAEDLDEPDRRQYYSDLCQSAKTVIAWNTAKGQLPLETQLSGFLATQPQPATSEELEAVRRELQAELSNAGYSGALIDAALAWEADYRVAPDQLVKTMVQLMAEAKERADQVFDLPMPPLPKVTLVQGAAFNARCDFANNTVELNTDPTITLGDLRHLVVHEVIPGHCLQFSARAQAYQEGWGGNDGLLSLVKSAGSPLFEGVADAGNELIGWTEPVDQVTMLISRLRAAIGTIAAWGIHHDGWSIDQAHAYLLQHALTGGEGWVNNRLGYISPRGRGAHVWSYWLGERHLRPVYRQHLNSLTPAFARQIYGRMHSLASLRLLAEPVES